jgi:hypothetical protein
MLALSVTSAMVLSGSLAYGQRPGQPVSGERPSHPLSPLPPAITNPIRPSPGVPPAVAVPPPSLLSPLRPSSPFEARPRTYAPRYQPRYDQPPRVPRRGGYYAPGFFGLDEQTSSLPPDAAPYPVDSNGQPLPYAPPQLPIVAPPHGPDTYYVIPGCYAGNRKPAPAQVPGCDIAKMKTTPVR